MWFHLTASVVDPAFRRISVRYRDQRLRVRVVLQPMEVRFAEILDDRGGVVCHFVDGLPATIEFDIDPTATHFRMELPDRIVIQPLRPIVFE